jgi:predicted DNA-binding ribbon-helix-helix protein
LTPQRGESVADLLEALGADDHHRLAALVAKDLVEAQRKRQVELAGFYRRQCVALFALRAQSRHRAQYACGG